MVPMNLLRGNGKRGRLRRDRHLGHARRLPRPSAKGTARAAWDGKVAQLLAPAGGRTN